MTQRRILVVEDEAAIRTMEERMLASAGYEVVACDSARSALARLDGERFDLFLLDVMMPGTSGYDLARSLKANRATRDVPIIFVTAKDGQEAVAEGFAAGAALYLVKPFTSRTLLSTVRAALGPG